MTNFVKKTALALALAAGTTAGAQSVAANFGVSTANFNFGTTALNVGVTVQNLTDLGGFPIDARVTADIGRVTAVNVDALINYETNGLLLYAGPDVNYAFNSGSGLGLGVVAGVNLPVFDQFGAFAELQYSFLNGRGLVTRLGFSYQF